MFHARVQLSKLSNAYFLDLSIPWRALYSVGIGRAKEFAFQGVSVLGMLASSSEVEEFCSDAVSSSVDPSTLEVSLGSSCTVWMESFSILGTR